MRRLILLVLIFAAIIINGCAPQKDVTPAIQDVYHLGYHRGVNVALRWADCVVNGVDCDSLKWRIFNPPPLEYSRDEIDRLIRERD